MVSVQICSHKRSRLLVSSDQRNEAAARMEAELWVAANPHRRMEVELDACGARERTTHTSQATHGILEAKR